MMDYILIMFRSNCKRNQAFDQCWQDIENRPVINLFWGAGIRWPAPQFQLWEKLKKEPAQPGIRIYHTHKYPVGRVSLWQKSIPYVKPYGDLSQNAHTHYFLHPNSFIFLDIHYSFCCLKHKTLNHKSVLHISTLALAFC
jgi:hypothetical protein